MNQIFKNARSAATALLQLSTEKTDGVLLALADNIVAATDELMKANASDMERMAADNPKRDRLALTPARIADIADGVRAVAALPSPFGNIRNQWRRPTGITITNGGSRIHI